MTNWGPWEIYAPSVAYEGVLGYGDPAQADRFVGYIIDPPSPTGQHGVGGNGPFYSPLDITLAPRAPYGVTWPSPTLQATGGAMVQTNAQALTVDVVQASDEPGGLGPTYTVAYTTVPEGDHLSGLVATNPTDRRVYIYTIEGLAQLLQRQSIPDPLIPPPGTVTPPTSIPPPTNLPPAVIARKLLEKANPGLTLELMRWNQYGDLATVRLGQKVVVTVEGVRGKLGLHSRGYVITRRRLRWQARATPVPQETLEITYTLEKILGTILPGAGTSDAAQDAAGTGGEVSTYAKWDTAGAGWGGGWAA